MDFKHVSGILERSLHKAGIARQVFSAMLIGRFSQAVIEHLGEVAAKKVQGMYIKNKVLSVACLHPVLAQELRGRETQILEKINQGLKSPQVEKIRYIL